MELDKHAHKRRKRLEKYARKYRRKLESRLSGKGILFERILDYETVAALKNNWLTNFAAGVNTDDIHIDEFMWHVFSYERLPCMKGDEATARFLAQAKAHCYILFQSHNYAYYLEHAATLAPNDFVNDLDFNSSDLYVVSKSFNWTYVVTHESTVGPYYYNKKMLL